VTVDLSVAVVNFQSAALCAGLVDSVLSDRFALDGREARVEVTIVDNASRGADVRALESLVSDRVRLVRNTENAGYAVANNQAFRVSSGRYHLVINPDCLVPRGALAALVGTLRDAGDAAVVGPLASMDAEGRALLPPNELPDPYREHLVQLARGWPAAADSFVRRRARYAHAYWTAREPLALDMLSGGCFLARRELYERHGLFDPGYPLYYEDTDLFRRLRDAGVPLLHAPASRIVHFFSRSSITRYKAALARNEVGARRYFRRYFGEAGLRALETQRARAAARGRDREAPWPLEERSAGAEPPVFDVGDAPGAYLEIAGSPQFTLAAGIFPTGSGPFALPAEFWRQLGAGFYWVRTVDPRDGGTLRAWSLTKTG
jgi:GT2 family glycosyltransferase